MTTTAATASHTHTHDGCCHGHVCWGGGPARHAGHRLEVNALRFSYRETLAVEDVSFSTECGRRLALIGPNGAGKSSLLKLLAGVNRPESGEMRWRGKPLLAAHHELAYLPQRGDVDWDFPLTVRGLVEMGRYAQVGAMGRFRSHDREIVDRAIETMELKDLAKRQIAALSGGQQQRAFIARALAQEAHVLLFDEPFTGLDRPAQEMLQRLFGTLTAEGRLLIASHHELETVRENFDDVLLLRRRQICFGPVETAFTPENIAAAYAR